MVRACRVYGYALPLARPLPGADGAGERRGLLLCLEDDAGTRAVGECAPLAGFSTESLETARSDLVRFADWVAGRNLPAGLECLDGGFAAWLGAAGYSASARCALEAAVLGLLAARRGTGLAGLLAPAPATAIPVAGLVDDAGPAAAAAARGLVAAGHHTVKLKVGPADAADHGARVTAVRRAMGGGSRLRLDANRAWSPAQARDFLARVARPLSGAAGAAIEFVEEPVAELDDWPRLGAAATVPLALDESLGALDAGAITDFPGLGAIVLKPTLLGLERAALFARAARRRGLAVVLSSSFESGIGRAILAQLAAAWGGADTAAGLGTGPWLADDLAGGAEDAAGPVVAVAPGPPTVRGLDHARVEALYGRRAPH